MGCHAVTVLFMSDVLCFSLCDSNFDSWCMLQPAFHPFVIRLILFASCVSVFVPWLVLLVSLFMPCCLISLALSVSVFALFLLRATSGCWSCTEVIIKFISASVGWWCCTTVDWLWVALKLGVALVDWRCATVIQCCAAVDWHCASWLASHYSWLALLYSWCCTLAGWGCASHKAVSTMN